MENTTHYPNLNDAEMDWLVSAASLRPDATLDDLIDSFIVLFPDRATHEELTTAEIRAKLTSRFNDVLYRTDRGYAQTIAEKRREYQQAFTSVFAVLNPLSLLNFYEQTYTNKKSKPSDKFKAIQAAEKLNDRLTDAAEKETQRQQKWDDDRQWLEMKFADKRSELSWRVSVMQVQTFVATLPEQLQEEINAEYTNSDLPLSEIALSLLRSKGMHAEAEKMSNVLRDDRYENKIAQLSPIALILLEKMLSNDTTQNIKGLDVIMDHFDKEFPNRSDISPMLSHLRNLELYIAKFSKDDSKKP